MKPTLAAIITGLAFLSALLGGAGWIIFSTWLADYYFGLFPLLMLVFFLVNAGFFFFFHGSLHKTDNQFVRSFMLTTMAKLMIFLILVLVYVITWPATAIAFSVTLSILYSCYTVYDLWVMLSLLKHKKPTAGNK